MISQQSKEDLKAIYTLEGRRKERQRIWELMNNVVLKHFYRDDSFKVRGYKGDTDLAIKMEILNEIYTLLFDESHQIAHLFEEEESD